MKLVFSAIAALAASSHGAVRTRRAATAGFCTGQLAGNYQHDTEALDSGYYYVCPNDESDNPLEMVCSKGNDFDADGNLVSVQLVFNPNSGNADCSITSPGGFCDFPQNVDFSANNGVDAAIDCTVVEASGDDAATTEAAATTADAATTAEPTTVVVTTASGTSAGQTTAQASTAAPVTMPAGYNPVFCASADSGNHVFEQSCNDGYYYQCSNGFTYLQQCPGGTVFDAATGACDWAENVAACGDSGSGDSSEDEDAATDAPATTAEVQSCDFDWTSDTAGQCVTSNACNGKASGYYQADDASACEGGAYYMCNWGVYTELTCGAGFRWHIPSPAPEWATQWYGYCDVDTNVTC
jgi:hypothetical protein